MKFRDLAIGQKFHCRDGIFTKTGPIQATAAGSSSPRVIQRSAVVSPVDQSTGSVSQGRRGNLTDIRSTFDLYHETCMRLLASSTPRHANDDELRELEELRLKLLHLLE